MRFLIYLKEQSTHSTTSTAVENTSLPTQTISTASSKPASNATSCKEYPSSKHRFNIAINGIECNPSDTGKSE